MKRTGEVVVGTTGGVAKCRSASRLGNEQRWDSRLTVGMRGVSWERVFGTEGMPAPVEV